MKILLLCALAGLAFGKVDYTGHKVYRAYPNPIQTEVIKFLGEHHNLDFWTDLRNNGDSVDFRVQPELQDRIEMILINNKIQYEIFIDDLEVALKAQISERLPTVGGDGTFDYNQYHTFDQIQQWIYDFPSISNGLGSVAFLGNSYEGRDMLAVKISTGGTGKPAFVIDCGIHAREWVSPATCIWVAKMLSDDYSSQDETVINLLNSIDFYLIPVANPDGYQYTWDNDRMWRKTRSPATSHCITNCAGVDPNRNWDNHWDTVNGASDSCCNDAYRGWQPFTEVEIVNQQEFVESIDNVRGYIDIHAYSQYWMYPYGWTTAKTPDDATLNKIGTDSVDAIKAVHGKTYVTGAISEVIYVASGSTADYFYDNGIMCSFAAELRDRGRYGFTLPESEIQPTAEETYAGLKVIAGYILDGTC